MAPPPRAAHALPVPLVHSPGGVQRGLPGVAAEEDPLPSERVLSGELLGERRREALASLRAAIGERPEGFAQEEWDVVIAVLSPPDTRIGHVGGQRARASIAVRARECFPGFPATAALRAFREVQARPHVAEVIADFRALEAVDVVEQRGMVREALGAVLSLATRTGEGESLGELMALDASGAAKIAASVVAAAKVLMDLDGLRTAPGAAVDANATGKTSADPLALAAKMRVVADDLRSRAAQQVVDATAEDTC